MAIEQPRTKEEIVAHILQQDMYQPDSGMYTRTRDRLMKLPYNLLQDLDLIITMKVIESNELDRKVQRILGKS